MLIKSGLCCYSYLIYYCSCLEFLQSNYSAPWVVLTHSEAQSYLPTCSFLCLARSSPRGHLAHSLTSCNPFLKYHLLSDALMAMLVKIAMPVSYPQPYFIFS